MQLYIMRHGIALELGEQGLTRDADRPLADEGIRRTRQIARGLAALGITLDHVGTSPLVRARQTADIVAEIIGRHVPPEEYPELAPAGSVTAVIAQLRQRSADSALLVGHLPDVAHLASELLTGDAHMGLVFKRAGICSIEFEGAPARGKGMLTWLMQPRHLMALAGSREP